MGLLIFFVVAFSTSPFSVGKKLHVAYKEYKLKNLFSVNTKYISSREFKTSELSLVLHTRENSDVFNKLDEIYLVFLALVCVVQL